MPQPKVSVVLPTLEEEAIFKIIRQIRDLLGTGTEIIAVVKGSEAYIRRLKRTGIKVMVQRDRGVERALVAGLREARGKILISTDADGTHDISGLPAAVKMVESGEADLVLGNRMRGLQPGSMGAYLAFGNSALSWIFSKLYRTRVEDILTGLFVMNRKAYESIRHVQPYRAGIAFFAIELAKRDFVIREVGIKYYRREHGESVLTRSKFAYGLGVAAHLIRQIRDYSPLIIFGGLGLVFIIFGFAIGLWVLLNVLKTGTLNFVGRALVSLMLVMSGVLSIILGFVLDLLLEIEKTLERRGREN